MSWRRIPVNPEIPAQSIRFAIPAGVWGIKTYWVGRLEAWFADLLDSTGAALVAGIRLATNSDLLKAYRAHEGMPPAGFVVLNLAAPGREAGRLDLGATARLFVAEPVSD